MTINDDNWQFLHNATGLSLTYNDMYYRYLKGLGYKGTLQQMIAKSGLGLNPSGGSNPVGGGASPPPSAGHVFLLGKNSIGNYITLRGKISSSVYQNLQGKVA